MLQDENGLWYNARWSEGQWLQSWSIMAKRYANNSAVVGAGLRNEPRPVLTGKMTSLMAAGLTVSTLKLLHIAVAGKLQSWEFQGTSWEPQTSAAFG